MAEVRPGVFIDVVMENDAVRVEKITLKPGARTGFHQHGIRHTMIGCNDGRTVRMDQNGRFEELLHLAPGASWQRSETFAHDVLNASENDVIMLKVFDKRAPRARRKKPSAPRGKAKPKR